MYRHTMPRKPGPDMVTTYQYVFGHSSCVDVKKSRWLQARKVIVMILRKQKSYVIKPSGFSRKTTVCICKHPAFGTTMNHAECSTARCSIGGVAQGLPKSFRWNWTCVTIDHRTMSLCFVWCCQAMLLPMRHVRMMFIPTEEKRHCTVLLNT